MPADMNRELLDCCMNLIAWYAEAKPRMGRLDVGHRQYVLIPMDQAKELVRLCSHTAATVCRVTTEGKV